MNSFWKFYVSCGKNGSHSEMRILGCDRSPLGTHPRVWPRPLAYIISSLHQDYLGFASINLLETILSFLWFVIPQLVSLIIHPELRLHLLHSYLCSRLCFQG
jgi:hypothetical protein